MIDNVHEHEDECTLVFVYNADAGLFNTLTDIAHKVFSPATYQCHLCELSHGYFTMREEWSAFISELELGVEFLHRDEFVRQHPGRSLKFPAILVRRGEALELCIDADTVNACSSIDELKSIIMRRCAHSCSHAGERKAD
jgi:hypothetical protein